MIPDEVKSRLRQLRTIVKEADVSYYKHDISMMPDMEYDAYVVEIEAIEEKYPELIEESSPTQVVVCIDAVGVEHTTPMLSLKKVYTTEEIRKWVEGIEKKLAKAGIESLGYTLEDKFDGFAGSIVYMNDGIRRIATRGTGRIGEIINQVTVMVKELPDRIEVPPLEEIEVRGEFLMTIEAFDELNERLAPEDRYATPRHAASGLSKLKNPTEADGVILFKAFDVISSERERNQMDKFRQLARLGFEIGAPKHYTVEQVEKLLSDIERENMSYDNCPFPVDGLVIKVNGAEAQSFLGATNKQPRWAIAYKFYTESHATRLLNVEWNVSRFGKHTPVGIIEPVMAYGVKISRVNLNGQQFDLPVLGTRMDVTLKGSVIPTMRYVYHETDDRLKPPTHCVSCGCPLDDEDLTCRSGWKCHEQLVERLVHFTSRRGLNIRGLGRDKIATLAKEAAVLSFSDIFRLDYETLMATFKGMRAASAYKLLAAIQNASNVTMERLVYALGVRGLSVVEASLVAQVFPTIEDLLAVNTERIGMHDGGAVNKLGMCLAFELDHYVNGDEVNNQTLKELTHYLTITK